MNKKILYLIYGIIGLIFIILIVLFIITMRTNKQKDASRLNQISQNLGVSSIVFSVKDNSIYYFDKIKTNFYKINLDNLQETSLTDQNFVTVKKVIWSQDKNLVIINALNHQYTFQGNLSPISNPDLEENKDLWWVYDFASKKANLIGDNKTTSALFGKDANIIYFTNNISGISTLYSINSDFSDRKIIREVGNAVLTDCSENSLAIESFEDKPITKIINIATKEFTNTLELAQSAKFSPDGNNILYDNVSDFESSKPELFNLTTKIKTPLDFETTTEKIFWTDNENLIIALSAKEEIFSFYNLTSKQDNVFYRAGRNINALELLLSQDKKYLYFVSDGLLFKLKII